MPNDDVSKERAKKTIGVVKNVLRSKQIKKSDNTFQAEPVLTSVVVK